jgi:ATP-dependent helicase HrpA
VEKRRVAFKKVDAALAHEIFVRDGLVAGVVKTDGSFLRHNLTLIKDAHEREAKERRRDLLVTDSALSEFYAARVPADVSDTRSFEQWRKRAEAQDPNILFMTPGDVLARLEDSAPEREFPSVISLDGVEFELKYSFAPGTVDDGLSLQVPLGLLAHVRQELLEWLVPGFFVPRCEAMVRTLPKTLRRRLAPVPDTIAELAPRLLRDDVYRRGRLARALADVIEASFRLSIDANDWDVERIPEHLRMNVQVRDDRGRLLDQDRDVDALKARLGERGRAALDADVKNDFEAHGLTEYPPAGVPETHLVGSGSAQMMLYPALVDRGNNVDLLLAEDPATQAALCVGGFSRLVILTESKGARFMRRELKARPTMGLHYASLGGAEALSDALLRASAWRCFFADRPLPRTRTAFDERIAAHRGEWMGVFNELVEKSAAALAKRFEIVRLLDEQTSPAFAAAVTDMRRQLERLMPSDFLDRTALEHLAEFPRYLSAVRFRLDHLQGRVQRDAEMASEIRGFEDRCDVVTAQLGSTVAVEAARFAIEELRVARFAQKLGTREKISPKRLERLIRPLEEDAGVR